MRTDKTDKRARAGASVSNVSASVPYMHENERPNGEGTGTGTVPANGAVRMNAVCSAFTRTYDANQVSVKSGTNNMHFRSFFFFLLLDSLLEGTDRLTLLTKAPRPRLLSVFCQCSGVRGAGTLFDDRCDCGTHNEYARGAGERDRKRALVCPNMARVPAQLSDP